jgi:deoxyribose-phosphate aldolase
VDLETAQIAQTLDLAVLKPRATVSDVIAACMAARQYNMASVCVRPDYVFHAFRELVNKKPYVPVCTVIGFPLGYGPLEVKLRAAYYAIQAGASEIDMVMNLGWFADGKYTHVGAEIKCMAEVCHKERGLLKVILETCYLSPKEIKLASQIAADNGADFVKTSTGFGDGGATREAVQIMLDTVGPKVGVKASGGIKTRATAVSYLLQGCKRLGVGSYEGILNECAKPEAGKY